MSWAGRSSTGVWYRPDRSKTANRKQSPAAGGSVPDPSGLMDEVSPPAIASVGRTSEPSAPESANKSKPPTEIELPGDLTYLFKRVGNHLVGAVLGVLGVAIGKGAVLKTRFCPRSISPGLGFVVCADQSEALDGACQAIIQALRDQGDKKLSKMGGGAKEIQEQIQQVEIERRAFFGADVVRDETVDGRFLAKIESLKALLHAKILVENPRPGTLDLVAQNSGGAGLLAYFNDAWFSGELDAVKRDPRNLALLSQGLQGKTPEISYARLSKDRQIVRPVVGVLITCTQETLSRLVCSPHPLVREFSEHLILARAPQLNLTGFGGADSGPLPGFWPSRIERFVALRDSGIRREFKLCRGAASALAAYGSEIASQQSEQLRWLRKSPITASSINIILHAWKGTKVDEITEKTNRAAIELARWLAQESAATARSCVAAEEDRAVRRVAAVMLQKLKDFGRPATRRELYQKYDDERRELHDPILEFLLRMGQVRWVESNRLEPTSKLQEH